MKFITSNSNKLNEARAIFPELEQKDIDLIEIQSIDANEVVKQKVSDAKKYLEESFICEDTALEIDSLNGFPGALVKWFIKSANLDVLANMIKQTGSVQATAVTVIGFFDKSTGKEFYFKGKVRGSIVSPKGYSFGFDPIFLPDGYDLTYTQMSKKLKQSISHRSKAFSALALHLKYRE